MFDCSQQSAAPGRVLKLLSSETTTEAAGRRPSRDEELARRQGCQPGGISILQFNSHVVCSSLQIALGRVDATMCASGNGFYRAAGASRVHTHDGGLYALLSERLQLSQGAQQAGARLRTVGRINRTCCKWCCNSHGLCRIYSTLRKKSLQHVKGRGGTGFGPEAHRPCFWRLHEPASGLSPIWSTCIHARSGVANPQSLSVA